MEKTFPSELPSKSFMFSITKWLVSLYIFNATSFNFKNRFGLSENGNSAEFV